MSELERRTIDELIARYELEPDLKDLYVEGVFDKDVFSACLSSSEETGLTVYEIDGINVPPELVFSHGLTDGNKQRLIVLARELQSTLRCDCSVVCLVDRDLDHWLGDLEVGKYLKWTCFCSIEACFGSEAAIKSILVDFHGSKIKNFPEYFDSLANALADLYALRLVDMHLSWGMTWIALEKCLSRKNDAIRFDLDTYVKRLLMKNSKIKRIDEFLTSYTGFREALTGDFRLFSRGHDMVELLAWSIKPFSGIRELASTLSVERAMVLLAGKSQDVITTLRAEIS